MKQISKLLLVAVGVAFLAGCGGGSSATYVSAQKPQPQKPQPKLIKAIEGRDFATAKELIEGGADVNAKDWFGNTPLYQATLANAHEVATLLIEKGANVNVKNNFGRTPLHGAAWNNDDETATLLIEKGADVNAKDNTDDRPLHLAVRANRYDITTLLIEMGADLHVKNDEGRTPANLARGRIKNALVAATEKRKREALIALIVRGAVAVNERDADTNTALHRMAKDNEVKLIQRLIAANAKVNIVNKRADTPLHFAARAQAQDAVNALLRAGANPYKSNVKGESAVGIAVETGDEDLIGEFVLADVDVGVVADLSSQKAQRDWEAEQELKRQEEAQRLAAEAKRLAEEQAREAERLAEAQREAERHQMWVDVAQGFAQGINRAVQLKTNLDNTERANQQLAAAQQAAAAAADQAAAAAQQAAALQQIADQRTATAGATQTATARGNSHSSIAAAQNNRRWVFGWLVEGKSRLAADNEALRQCRLANAGFCSIVHRWEGPGCAATAIKSDSSSGAWAVAGSRSAAERSALDRCGGDCRVDESRCASW